MEKIKRCPPRSSFMSWRDRRWVASLLLISGLLVLSAGLAGRVMALDDDAAPVTETSPTNGSSLHPDFPLLDDAGANVLDSGRALSTMSTCGACHDAEFITEHSFHSDVGLEASGAPGSQPDQPPWDTSPGIFGQWNPITYRALAPYGDERPDMTTADWIRNFGARHVGGGPAETSRDGHPLNELPSNADLMDSHIVDPESGELVPWDWEASGVVEMNCFLCHTLNPDNESRIAALQEGAFQWANTATLAGQGIVALGDDGWNWNEEAFTVAGELRGDQLKLQDPSSENCGQCHGLVHVDAQTPAALAGCTPAQWSTITTGQIVSPQRISESGVNVAEKTELTRSWDVHAERVTSCTDCHYSLNNPVYFQEDEASRPEHLTFDPRRIDISEYLYRPLHQFAKGQSAQGNLAPELDNTLRRCESCHSIEKTHNWLPYKDRHTSVLSCESCHIPNMYAPARQSMDWTALQADGTPLAECRGLEEEGQTFSSALITGFQPVLLPRAEAGGTSTLAPHNLVSSWFWVHGDMPQPVAYRDLQAAWFEDGAYAPEIMELFDTDGDTLLTEAELVLDSEAKVELIRRRLGRLGLENPRIEAEVRPYSISHTVAHGDWAVRQCGECHGEESRLTQVMLLSGATPGGVVPQWSGGSGSNLGGDIMIDEGGTLFFQPDPSASGLYILGHDNVALVDTLGALMFAAVVLGVVVHGGLRVYSARRRPAAEPVVEEVYMYGVYERLWHWLQTLVIMILLFTGLIIHKPEFFGVFSFSYVVQVHNVMAAILLANAALALFYNLASGEIRQYLPRPRGFFNRAIEQTLFYVRGIFKGDEHPFEKTPQRRLNPLQQVTYFAILNVLLPLQIITGILMWGAQRWPEAAAATGGLPLLGPFHTLIAWSFASFIVLHVYLTTTGHRPVAGIKSMVMGWDEVEVHAPPPAEETV